jgi:Ca2+/H+ antiporter, TMEM165/GDT1 family
MFAEMIAAFGVVFLAEIGDKTQLTAMALATRYPWKRVFLGIAAAFALLNLGAVLVGKVLYAFLPIFWVKLASALLFLFFGVAALMAKEEGGGEEEDVKGKNPIATAFVMIFLAELGDKTQLVTTSLAAQSRSLVGVFCGSTLALWSVSLLGIFCGKQLGKRLTIAHVHRASGILFLVFAAAILWQLFLSGNRIAF